MDDDVTELLRQIEQRLAAMEEVLKDFQTIVERYRGFLDKGPKGSALGVLSKFTR